MNHDAFTCSSPVSPLSYLLFSSLSLGYIAQLILTKNFSLPETSRETTTVANIGVRLVEVAANSGLSLVQNTLPLAGISLVVQVKGVVESSQETSLGHALCSSRANAHGAGESVSLRREQPAEEVGRVAAVHRVSRTLVEVLGLEETEGRADLESWANREIGRLRSADTGSLGCDGAASLCGGDHGGGVHSRAGGARSGCWLSAGRRNDDAAGAGGGGLADAAGGDHR